MTALSADRMTPSREGELYKFPLAADAVIYLGAMVALNGSGNLVPASDTAGLTVVGRAEEKVDNTGGAAGAKSALTRRGTFGFNASGTNIPDNTDVGSAVYVEDDSTVGTDPGSNEIEAGTLVAVDDDYAWVRI